MSDHPDGADPDGATWRLATPGDVPFVYELITLVDPRGPTAAVV